MTSPQTSPLHPSSTSAPATDSDPDLPDGIRNVGVGQEGAAEAFRAEIAALLALDDTAFCDVLPATRPVIIALVAARGPDHS